MSQTKNADSPARSLRTTVASHGVIIPASVLASVGLTEGAPLEISLPGHQRLVLTRAPAPARLD